MPAFALLIGLQFAVTWSSVRARWVRRLATGEPLMLLYCGEFLPAAAAASAGDRRRNTGGGPLSRGRLVDQVRAVVLETDGSFSVVRPGEGGNGSSLVGVDGPQEVREPAER